MQLFIQHINEVLVNDLKFNVKKYKDLSLKCFLRSYTMYNGYVSVWDFIQKFEYKNQISILELISNYEIARSLLSQLMAKDYLYDQNPKSAKIKFKFIAYLSIDAKVNNLQGIIKIISEFEDNVGASLKVLAKNEYSREVLELLQNFEKSEDEMLDKTKNNESKSKNNMSIVNTIKER